MITRTQLKALGLFDAKVPRYTSYPTAPHFAGGIGPEDHARWVSLIPPGSAISLYIHVPFCRRLCWFCACRTQGTSTLAPVAAYLETLKLELRHLAQHLPRGVTLARVHWGGGTPTLLSPEMMEELMAATADVAAMAPGAEFSVEIDPGEVDAPRLDALARGGMTRASIGVQDFDPDIQKTIGREQSFELTRNVVDMIRARGIDSLNTDILYGLPHQTRGRITASVQKLLSLNPDRVALYGYAHVPWMARRQQLIPSDALPTPEARLELFETARRLFTWDGYDEIGIDHFARKDDGLAQAARDGRLRRNFQGYTDDAAQVLIGVGASSISRFPQGYTQNASATAAHTKAVRDNAFSTARGHEMSAEDTLRARLIEEIMCSFGIDRASILSECEVTEAALDAMLDKVARQFPDAVLLDGCGLRIPPEARALTRMIARGFDAYEVQQAGHSHAI